MSRSQRRSGRAQMVWGVVWGMGVSVFEAPAYGDKVTFDGGATLPRETSASPSSDRSSELISRLPPHLERRWKRVLEPLDTPPALESSGGIILATRSGVLMELDRDGKERGRTRLPSPVSQGPVLTRGGDRVVITREGEVLSFSPAGTLRYRLPTGGVEKEPRALLQSTPHGGVFFTTGTTAVVLDAEGRRIRQTVLPPDAGSVVRQGSDALLWANRQGEVFQARIYGEPRRLGHVGGRVTHLVVFDETNVAALVEGNRLVVLDLTYGTTTIAFRADAAGLEPRLTVDDSGHLWMGTTTGTLLAFDAKGQEHARIAIDTLGAPLRPYGLSTTSASWPWLVTATGDVAFVRAGGILGTVRDGRIEITDPSLSAAPVVGLVANGTRVVVACRDGTVAAF